MKKRLLNIAKPYQAFADVEKCIIKSNSTESASTTATTQCRVSEQNKRLDRSRYRNGAIALKIYWMRKRLHVMHDSTWLKPKQNQYNAYVTLNASTWVEVL